jgi:hypothetical protein
MPISFYSNISCSIETKVRERESFTDSSRDRKAWATQGGLLLGDFMADGGKYNDFLL